jgi:SAM-dependent methyltransferase
VTDLAIAPRPVVRGDAVALPLRDGSAGGVAALWMLYPLDEPLTAIRECFRVLRPRGLPAASATSRADSQELAHLLDRRPSPFDAEEAPALLGSWFPDVEVVTWDGPLVWLPSREAVHDYLVGRLAARKLGIDPAVRRKLPRVSGDVRAAFDQTMERLDRAGDPTDWAETQALPLFDSPPDAQEWTVPMLGGGWLTFRQHTNGDLEVFDIDQPLGAE